MSVNPRKAIIAAKAHALLDQAMQLLSANPLHAYPENPTPHETITSLEQAVTVIQYAFGRVSP